LIGVRGYPRFVNHHPISRVPAREAADASLSDFSEQARSRAGAGGACHGCSLRVRPQATGWAPGPGPGTTDRQSTPPGQGRQAGAGRVNGGSSPNAAVASSCMQRGHKVTSGRPAGVATDSPRPGSTRRIIRPHLTCPVASAARLAAGAVGCAACAPAYPSLSPPAAAAPRGRGETTGTRKGLTAELTLAGSQDYRLIHSLLWRIS
jgi:hypothetical protein